MDTNREIFCCQFKQKIATTKIEYTLNGKINLKGIIRNSS